MSTGPAGISAVSDSRQQLHLSFVLKPAGSGRTSGCLSCLGGCAAQAMSVTPSVRELSAQLLLGSLDVSEDVSPAAQHDDDEEDDELVSSTSSTSTMAAAKVRQSRSTALGALSCGGSRQPQQHQRFGRLSRRLLRSELSCSRGCGRWR